MKEALGVHRWRRSSSDSHHRDNHPPLVGSKQHVERRDERSRGTATILIRLISLSPRLHVAAPWEPATRRDRTTGDRRPPRAQPRRRGPAELPPRTGRSPDGTAPTERAALRWGSSRSRAGTEGLTPRY